MDYNATWRVKMKHSCFCQESMLHWRICVFTRLLNREFLSSYQHSTYLIPLIPHTRRPTLPPPKPRANATSRPRALAD